MNKPVAWMMKSNDPDYVSDYIMFKTPERKDKISHHAIPLYTHPVKELTDEEIEELWYDPKFIGDPVAFGKAVLRSTQNIPLQKDEEICKKCDEISNLRQEKPPFQEPSVKEIDDLWLDVINNIPANDHRPREWHFAKAILRKAQEK